jgi:glycosyltransferase involved in cell wall biosynthesis
MGGQPFVSVVTPFYNTAPYISQCIESVLAQTWTDFEFLLVNNKSTDGSREIAERYARADPRIRLVDNESFLPQLENFNGALAHISPQSKYVKFVLADDLIFPECLAQMVALGESEPAAGLIASYYLHGEHPAGSGVPYGVSRLEGVEACRRMLLGRGFPLGTPSTVLYRGDIVRSRHPFFRTGDLHADTNAGYEVLLEHDLGFVHQVLSFVRTDNESLSGERRQFHTQILDYYIVFERYGRRALSPEQFERRRAEFEAEYYSFLGRALLRLKGRRFWEYHRAGLATIGRKLRWRDVLPRTVAEFARLALNPQSTLQQAFAELRRRRALPRGARRG